MIQHERFTTRKGTLLYSLQAHSWQSTLFSFLQELWHQSVAWKVKRGRRRTMRTQVVCIYDPISHHITIFLYEMTRGSTPLIFGNGYAFLGVELAYSAMSYRSLIIFSGMSPNVLTISWKARRAFQSLNLTRSEAGSRIGATWSLSSCLRLISRLVAAVKINSAILQGQCADVELVSRCLLGPLLQTIVFV